METSITFEHPGIVLPLGAELVIRDIMTRAGTKACMVTSTARTPYDQARVMYDNIQAKGVEAQMALYKLPGQKVVQVYTAMVTSGHAGLRDSVIAGMEAKILELGPSTVSRHCAGPDSPVWVIDIAPSSIANPANFIVHAEHHARVTKVLRPPADPAIHLEILKA